jgi:hypothetical protein
MGTPQSLITLQVESQNRARDFIEKAAAATDPKTAADWSLAAKNSIQVALTCEQIVKTRNAR